MCTVSVNFAVLNPNYKEKHVAFVDQIVQAFLSGRNENPELHILVRLY